MDRVAVGLSVISLAASLLLLFAYAELRRRHLSLESYVLAGRPPTADVGVVRDSVLALGGERHVFLVVDDRCLGCHERLVDLERWVFDGRVVGSVTVVKADGTFGAANSGIRYIIDPRLVGALRPDATPQVVIVDARGNELARRIIGSTEALCDALDLPATEPTSLTPSTNRGTP